MMNEKSGFGMGGMFMAFLGGAMVGTAAALLLAPGSGEETRARLGGAFKDARDQVRRAPMAAAAAVEAAKEALAEGMRDGH
jgi:gas vesicle protein